MFDLDALPLPEPFTLDSAGESRILKATLTRHQHTTTYRIVVEKTAENIEDNYRVTVRDTKNEQQASDLGTHLTEQTAVLTALGAAHSLAATSQVAR
jgi:hypothetical protein